MASSKLSSPAQLPTFDAETETLNAVIETPKGSRNKFTYDEKLALFKLSGVLPAGAVFPFDFGFLPSTLGQDGDPLDVLVLMDEPAFAGCLVSARLLGVIEAEQTEDGETTRNDRLIAVAAVSRQHRDVRDLSDLGDNLVNEIEHFFVSYNAVKGKEFKPLGRFGPDRAERLIRESQGRLRESGKEEDGKTKPPAAGKKARS
jgi:inorganic pyrophosphatase